MEVNNKHLSTVDVLRQSAASLDDQLPQQQYAPKPWPTNEQAQQYARTGRQTTEQEVQNLLNLASESVERIHTFGTDRISRTEELCQKAREALDTKRNAVNRSMAEYLAALDALQNITAEHEKALSNVIVQNDALGH